GPKEIAEQTGQVGSQVRLVLRRMLNSQEIISPAYGLYTVHGHRSLKTPSLYQKTTPETPETLESLESLESLETLETVNDLGSNSTPIPVAPAPAQPPPLTQTTLDTLTKKIRTLFYCTHDIHYVQWLIFNTKIGCPICDGWLVRDIINDPTVLGLFETLNKHAPRENEHRRAWLER